MKYTNNTVNSKVFGIGLGKTGTSSLTAALQQLGYNAVHFPDPSVLQDVFNGKYDAATDTPIALNFRKLYELFPDAKFLLTVRNITDWMKSIETHMSTKSKNAHNIDWIADLRVKLYGDVFYDPEKYRNAYLNHMNEVLTFFGRNRAMSQLRIINIIEQETDSDRWKSICEPLGLNIPDTPFPHVNKGRYNQMKDQKIDVFKITGA